MAPKSLALFLICILGISVAFAKPLTPGQKRAYSRLRKDFFLAVALPPSRTKKTRKEHRDFIRQTRKFRKKVGEDHPGHAAAADYYKGRMYLKIRRLDKARKAFDSSLALLRSGKVTEDNRPGSMPSACTIAVFRAFTFSNDGNETVLAELEAIPEKDGKPTYHDVGATINRWADSLEQNDLDEEARRAYVLALKWDLWEDESDNPKRKLDRIKMKTQDLSLDTPQVEPETQEAQAEEGAQEKAEAEQSADEP
ncbi:MAG: hypothetical protein KAI66_07755 [Lentisphaeria bacterium]|nr:hypothetical protein [Lentisphaeria bacterium]